MSRPLVALRAKGKAAPRSCGTCDACCVHLHIREWNKPPHAPCDKLASERGKDPSRSPGSLEEQDTRSGKWKEESGKGGTRLEKGCSIYATRPTLCASFQCLWLTGHVTDGELRPDRCGVIFSSAQGMLGPAVSNAALAVTECWANAASEGKAGAIVRKHAKEHATLVTRFGQGSEVMGPTELRGEMLAAIEAQRGK